MLLIIWSWINKYKVTSGCPARKLTLVIYFEKEQVIQNAAKVRIILTRGYNFSASKRPRPLTNNKTAVLQMLSKNNEVWTPLEETGNNLRSAACSRRLRPISNRLHPSNLFGVIQQKGDRLQSRLKFYLISYVILILMSMSWV